VVQLVELRAYATKLIGWMVRSYWRLK